MLEIQCTGNKETAWPAFLNWWYQFEESWQICKHISVQFSTFHITFLSNHGSFIRVRTIENHVGIIALQMAIIDEYAYGYSHISAFLKCTCVSPIMLAEMYYFSLKQVIPIITSTKTMHSFYVMAEQFKLCFLFNCPWL